MERTFWIGLGALFMCTSLVNASPYSKYGRSCKDIGCRSNEVCVMESDPCTYSRDQCGSYPTCKRTSDSGGLSCTTKICPGGQYCKTVNGVPTCTDTSPNRAPIGRRPNGRHHIVKPILPPTPPPRSFSFGYGGRYPSAPGRNSIGTRYPSAPGRNSIGNRYPAPNHDYTGRNSAEGSRGRIINPDYYKGDSNNYNTHVNTDNRGNRIWTFSG